MRASLGDHLLTLGRPAAVAALAAAAGGAVAIAAPTLSAWALVARVDALGTVDRTTVALVTCHEVSPVAWVASGVGAVVVVLALLVALDRPPGTAERLLFAGAATIATIVLAVVAGRPTVEEVLARAASDVGTPTAALPAGVEITYQVVPAAGLALLTGAAVLIALGTVVATRRG